ncbi:MAG TPA: hypothetical protein VGE41_10065, partial [Verrucomicrobiae bacterium]
RSTKELRDAQSIVSYSSNQITFINGTNATVSYSFSSTNRTLNRIVNNITNQLLTECDSASISVYQRTPIQNTFDYNAPVDTNEAKVVYLSWNCSRTMVGKKLTTDSAQIGKVVLRSN